MTLRDVTLQSDHVSRAGFTRTARVLPEGPLAHRVLIKLFILVCVESAATTGSLRMLNPPKKGEKQALVHMRLSGLNGYDTQLDRTAIATDGTTAIDRSLPPPPRLAR